MNKTELVAKIAEVAGLSKADAKKALDATVEAVKEALVAGDNVPAREGVNPRTGEKLTIAAKKVVKFKAGAELANAVK